MHLMTFSSTLHYFLNSIIAYSMGCEPSHQQAEIAVTRIESFSTEEDVEIEAEKIINRQRGDPHELYHFSRVIWRGRSIVRKVLERNSRIDRVCKILNAGKSVSLLNSFQQVEVLKKLNHPNIVQIVEYFSQSNFLYIMFESIPGKSLHQLYYEQEMRSLEVIIEIVKQILIAVKFCHQKGYVHKAINPEHIMLVKLGKSRKYLVKLVGFGRALRFGAHRVEKNAMKQDPIFTPPEVDNEAYADRQDVWGCGIIFLEMISGQRKFQDFLERKEVIINEVIKKQNMPEQHKAVIINFLTKMLEISPEKRMSVEQALNHQIFTLDCGKAIYINSSAEVMKKLLQYRVQNNLKSLFYIYATLNILSVEEKSQYLVQFYNLDKNKDGKIDFDELVEGMQNSFDVDQETAIERVKKIFQMSNKEREHHLEFHEYVAATTMASKEFFDQKLKKLFDELDSNKDGKITAEELNRAVEGVRCSKLLEGYENKAITFQQFRELLQSIFEEKGSEL